MANTNAEEVNSHAVSPVSIFGGGAVAGLAAGVSGGAGVTAGEI